MVEDFVSGFEIDDAVVDRFQEYLNSRTRYNIPFVAYKEEVRLYLKATLAEQLYGSEASVQVLNTNDSMLQSIPTVENKEELCLKWIQSNGLALAFVPQAQLTMDLCLLAVQQNGMALSFVPDHLRTKKICL